MTENEYNEIMINVTVNGDCDRCVYGCVGECYLQCNRSYDDYMREIRGDF